MSEIQACFQVSIQDYLLLDNCLGFAFGLINLKSQIGDKQLNRKDKLYKKWIESVMQNLQNQVEKSTHDLDAKLLNKELEIHSEFRADFGKVMGEAQAVMIEHYLDKAK